MVHQLGATCLGYMDDLAVIIPKNLDVQFILDEVTRVADALKMSFNIKKCGIINQEKPTTLKSETIPQITSRCSYQYLGASAADKKLEGLMESFEKFKNDCQTVLNSALTPMQKLNSLRTHLLPKLYHLVENTSPKQSTLRKINSFLRKITKTLCFLPEKATNSYVHLSRLHGGPGIPDMVWLTRTKILVAFFQTMNNDQNFTSAFCDLVHCENLVDQIHIRHDCPPLKKKSYRPYHRNSTNFLRIALSS